MILSMRYLITGAAGFLGTHLYLKLKSQGQHVVGIDNFSHPCGHISNKEIKYADIRYINSIAPYIGWCDFCFHLGAIINIDQSIKFAEETIATNINGTLNILELVKRYNKKMLFASTSEVYGTSQMNLMDEAHPTNPQSPYAASKLAGDALCRAYYQTYGTRAVILRNFNVFGSYQNAGEGAGSSYGSVIAIFVKRALNNEPLYIFGDGKQERDYMSADDAVSAYELCVNKFDDLVGQVINMGSGKTITINRLAELVIKMTNSKSEIIHTEARAGEVRRLNCDNSKARSFGLVPQTDFERDLEKYIKEKMLVVMDH